MNRMRWRLTVISTAAAIAVVWGGNWFAGRMVRTDYPERLAYKPADDFPPAVDLAAVQRGWPNGLSDPAERRRLLGYMHDPTRQGAVMRPSVPTSPAAQIDLGRLLAEADTGAGKVKASVCTTCHDLTKGGPNRIGPNLWGVIGRGVGSHAGFAYSSAMAGQGGVWSYDRLFTFLGSPAQAVPGTKMGFAGMARPEDRAALLKYLVTLSDRPPPLPPSSGTGNAK